MSGETTIPLGKDLALQADLALPPDSVGVIAFAHGSGSGRHSPRNRQVAELLRGRGLATLLLDLLTPEEERVDLRTGELRFDIGLLADRLEEAVRWLGAQTEVNRLPIGLFGASTGAAAALVAAARRPKEVAAVVSRGGRPDLAGDALPHVAAPTLLIVGERDQAVLDLNRAAQARLGGETHLEIVPGAGHLFEEPGTLNVVADLAGDWFLSHLATED